MFPSHRQELEDRWREKVRLACLRYEEAAKAFRATWHEHLDERPMADPAFAIEQARKVESEALAEYVRVLKIFSDLLLRGKIPEEPPE